jgi:hypothetical protein
MSMAGAPGPCSGALIRRRIAPLGSSRFRAHPGSGRARAPNGGLKGGPTAPGQGRCRGTHGIDRRKENET